MSHKVRAKGGKGPNGIPGGVKSGLASALPNALRSPNPYARCATQPNACVEVFLQWVINHCWSQLTLDCSRAWGLHVRRVFKGALYVDIVGNSPIKFNTVANNMSVLCGSTVPASPHIGGLGGAGPTRFGGSGGPPGGSSGASRGGYGGGGGRGGPDDRMIGQITTIRKGPFRCARCRLACNFKRRPRIWFIVFRI